MEKIPEKWEDSYRYWHTDRFLFQLMQTLNTPKSQEDVSEGIDKIVANLEEFIEKRAKNIHSSPDFQKQTFEDVCLFLNSLAHNFKIKKFHNSVPITPLKDYKNKTIGEQFINNAYKYDWKFDTDRKGGNCSYWTIMLYQFFNRLKKAGLNIDVKIYRLKNKDDNFAGILSLRHSGLIINFDGEDYLCDYDGVNFVYGEGNVMVQSLSKIKEQARISAMILASQGFKDTTNNKIGTEIDYDALDELATDNQGIKHSRLENFTKTLLFDDEDSFIEDVEKYPGPQRIIFHSPVASYGEYPKIQIEFLPGGINLLNNENNETLYVLDENAVLDSNPEKFFQSLVNQLKYVKMGGHIREITKREQDYLLTNLEFIKKYLDIPRLVKSCAREEPEVKKRRAGIIPALGNFLKIVKERYKSLVH